MGDGNESGPMIEAEGLVKHYGQTRALAGVGFAVPAGTVSGDGRRLSAGVDAAPGLATALVRALDAAGALVDNTEVRRPRSTTCSSPSPAGTSPATAVQIVPAPPGLAAGLATATRPGRCGHDQYDDR